MDWNAAVEKNREALKRILAMLVAMAEVGLGGRFIFSPHKSVDVAGPALAEKSKLSPALTLPRHLHRAMLRLLRPAEAAARRLIIVAARGLVMPPPRPRKPAVPGTPTPARKNPGPCALPLFDRLSPWRVRVWRAPAGVPRISVPGYSEPFPIVVPGPDDPVDAARLAARLATLAATLDDLPAQARRFARWRARAAAARSRMAVPPPVASPHEGEGNPAASLSSTDGGGFFAAQPQNPPPPCGEGLGVGVRRRRVSRPAFPAKIRSRRVWPLKPGWPPGWRRKPTHEVHEVLDVVHGLAIWVLNSPDTS